MSEWRGGIINIQNIIISVPKNSDDKEELYTFPTETFFGPQTRVNWANFLWTTIPKDEHICVCHTTEYLIKVLALNEGNVIRHFRREYSRVSNALTDEELERNQRFNIPNKKYKNDIVRLFQNQDFLWVQTSTQDELKGTLFDIFNNDGIYIDNFYLKVIGTIMTIIQDSVYVKETDSSGNIQIVKYNFKT